MRHRIVKDFFRHIVIAILLLFYFNVPATAQTRIAEIDSVEYINAMWNFIRHDELSGYPYRSDYPKLTKDFLYDVINKDNDAKNVFIDSFFFDGERYEHRNTSFKSTPIILLQFYAPLESFVYAATIKPDDRLSISDVRINSSPVAISDDGYVAGFKDSNDAYCVDMKIYKMSITDKGDLDIKEIFAYDSNEEDGNYWHVWNWSYPAFWNGKTLYIRGNRLIIDGDESRDVPCYYKVEIGDIEYN